MRRRRPIRTAASQRRRARPPSPRGSRRSRSRRPRRRSCRRCVRGTRTTRSSSNPFRLPRETAARVSLRRGSSRRMYEQRNAEQDQRCDEGDRGERRQRVVACQDDDHEHGVGHDRRDSAGVENVEPLRPLQQVAEEPERSLHAERERGDHGSDLCGAFQVRRAGRSSRAGTTRSRGLPRRTALRGRRKRRGSSTRERRSHPERPCRDGRP